MNPSLILAFWGTTFLLIVVPGPDWAFTLASGVRDRIVFPSVGGLMLGYALLTAIVAAGVAALVASTPIVLTLLTVIGAVYLVYLGIWLLRRPGSLHVPAADDAAPSPWWRQVAKGVGVSSLNPKGLLIFLALLPQFADPAGSWPFPVQIAILGLVFVLTCGLFYSFIGLGARAVLRTRPGVARIVSRVSGVAMIFIGLFLLIERLAPGLNGG